MKALVKYKKGKNSIKVMDMPEPVPNCDEIKVKVNAVGICGTDIHIMEDEYPYYNPPVVLGHEFVGVVEEVGSGVENFNKGDYVISLTAAVTCGKCKYCREGLLMLCDQRLSIGSGVNGAMAEYVTIPADLAFKVPGEVEDIDEYAMSEPVACVVRGVIERSDVRAGDIVLVSGPGTIGLLTVQLAKLQGAYVIASGIKQDIKRLELAQKLGADRIATSKEELFSIIDELTPYGVDIAFECAGVSASAETCLESLRKQGIFSQVGLYGKDISIDFDKFLFKELIMTNSYASERTSWEIAIRLMKNNQLNLTPLVSKKLPLEKWEEGFNMFMNKEGYKILLKP